MQHKIDQKRSRCQETVTLRMRFILQSLRSVWAHRRSVTGEDAIISCCRDKNKDHKILQIESKECRLLSAACLSRQPKRADLRGFMWTHCSTVTLRMRFILQSLRSVLDRPDQFMPLVILPLTHCVLLYTIVLVIQKICWDRHAHKQRYHTYKHCRVHRRSVTGADAIISCCRDRFGQ